MIRSTLKRGIKKLLGMEEAAQAAPPPPAPAWKPVPEVKAEAPKAEAPKAEAPKEPEAPSIEEAIQVEAPQAPDITEPQAAEPMSDTVGPAMSFDAVQAIMDDMVRPALQGDGGDISLIKVENNDIYVKLVGSCSTCPSSIMTMKMGVEALLKEEFPSMGSLIQVE